MSDYSVFNHFLHGCLYYIMHINQTFLESLGYHIYFNNSINLLIITVL